MCALVCVCRKKNFSGLSLECWEAVPCILKQRGEQQGSESSRLTSESRCEGLELNLKFVRAETDKTHTCARHRGLIGGADKSRAPAESPRRNGFHFASSIDGPPGSFHCLCASGDSNLKTASRATITLRSNHTAGGEALEAV